jgi:nicotinamide-nucleotide amidase
MTNDLNPLPLSELALRAGRLLRERAETVAVSESSAGGLVSAALLAIPGASAYFLGGAVVYTRQARRTSLGLSDADVKGIWGETEPYVDLTANRIRDSLGATWGLSESGFAGPTGSARGGVAGHVCFAVAGPLLTTARTYQTGQIDRGANMDQFARRLLSLFCEVLETQPSAPSA